jgi:hypothetical protein
MADCGSQGGVPSVYFDRRGLPCFGAGDDSLASVPDVGSNDEWNDEIQRRERN